MSKEFQKIWDSFPKQVKIEQAKHFLNNCKSIHKVNKLIVFEVLMAFRGNRGNYVVVNEETLHCKFFDTEEESINYCLDVYQKTFSSYQTELFERKTPNN